MTEWIGDTYFCPLATTDGTRVAAVVTVAPDAFEVRGVGGDPDLCVAAVCRQLGVQFALEPFAAACATVPWLARLSAATAGVRPACFPTVWEAAVNALVYQSVSMMSAAAVMDRLLSRFAGRIAFEGATVERFPEPERLAAAPDAVLRATGLSAAKCVALRAIAAASIDGRLNGAGLAALATPELCATLAGVRGIGPWSAAVIALRGFGRLDVFPPRDSGVARTVGELAARVGAPTDGATAAAQALVALGDQRGMLYHLLLLERHARSGKLRAESSRAGHLDALPALTRQQRSRTPIGKSRTRLPVAL